MTSIILFAVAGAIGLPAWRGADFAAWKHNVDVAEMRPEGEALVGRVTGRDGQLYVTLRKPLVPRANHVVKFRLALSTDGEGQVFWQRRGDASMSEQRQCRFLVTNAAHGRDFTVRPHWLGDNPITTLRLDFPPECRGGATFALSDVRIETEGEEHIYDAEKIRGVAFSLKEAPGLHYGRLSWGGENGAGFFAFSTAPDGERHEYWFDLKRNLSRFATHWKGRIGSFEITRPFAEAPLPVENMRLLEAPPATPPDPVITSAFPSEAIPRAGRPLAVEVIVRNYGTRPAEGLSFSFEGLPAGKGVRNADALRPRESLAGCDGTESLDNDCRVSLAHERRFRFELDDLGVGSHTFTITLAAKGVAPRRRQVTARVRPSLNLSKADYPPEPRPISTAPYEVGALLFPGWVNHKWHAVWSHDPARKPLLGWYDETKSETIDWQIKHLVENGISFVSVDFYWRNRVLGTHHWADAFAKARYRRYLKWHLMWDNGYNSAEDQEALATYWCTNLFHDTQYQKINGKPIVAIFSPFGMEQRMAGKGGAKRLIDITQRIARAHGFPGVWFVAMRCASVSGQAETAASLRDFATWGFDSTAAYGFRGAVAGTRWGLERQRPFSFIADASPAHWRMLQKNSPIPFWPSLSTSYDDRPWRGERVLEITGYNARDFRRIALAGRAFADETGRRTILLGPLDEWGEGSIGYPNREHGFGILEAVRDTFGQMPEGGWPVNFAPEDVGLTCPQRD